MIYNHVAIMLHRACTAACESCCVESGPGCKERLSIDRVKDYINSLKDVSYIKSVGFSGGEPFLQYEMLKELITYVNRNGKAVSTATNGFWADTYEIAWNKLLELKKAGLNQVGLSYDYFHSKYIPAKNIRNILLAANDLEMPTALNVVITKNHTAGAIIDSLGDSVKETQLMIIPCQAVGNAKKHVKDVEYIRSRKSKGCYCKKNASYAVCYDGSIWPCCSPYIFDTELYIGNYENLDAAASLEKLRNNRILYLLRNYGFDYFIKIAENELGMDVPEYVISACELCSMFFNRQNIHKFYPYVFETMNELSGKGKEKDKIVLS